MLGEGPLAPAVVHAFGADDDFAALDLNVAAFDLSDRGVEGVPHPVLSDAFVWLDRGILPAGRDGPGDGDAARRRRRPPDIPATVTVKRPNGQVFCGATPPRTGDASLYLPVVLSRARRGTWHVEINADPKAPPIGSTDFRVDAFVPDRMAVEAGPLPPTLSLARRPDPGVGAVSVWRARLRTDRQSDDAPGARPRSVSGAGGLSHRSGG